MKLTANTQNRCSLHLLYSAGCKQHALLGGNRKKKVSVSYWTPPAHKAQYKLKVLIHLMDQGEELAHGTPQHGGGLQNNGDQTQATTLGVPLQVYNQIISGTDISCHVKVRRRRAPQDVCQSVSSVPGLVSRVEKDAVKPGQALQL